MNNDFLNIFDGISLRKFKKKFGVTWVLILAGLIGYFLFVFIAFQTPQKSFPYYLLQNVGIFILLTLILVAYSSVSFLVSKGESDTSVPAAIRESIKKAPYIIGTAGTLVIAFSIVVAIESLIAYLGIVSKVGPVFLGLLTIPYFIINLVCLVAIICIMLAIPPYVSGDIDKKTFLPEIQSVLLNRWLEILVFTIVSISLLVLGVFVLYYIIAHATGITRSLQWNIASFYPNMLNTGSMKSFFSDIAMKIAPGSDSIGLIAMYDLGIFTYGQMLTLIISASYVLLYSCVVAFPLSLYFWGSSVFFGRMFRK